MVPSRSMNTARDFALVEVMFEARNQFVAGYSCCAQFSDDHGAGVIGDLRGFERRRAANQREREHRDGGVTRARHIENISRLRRNVMRAFAFLEKHHPMFAQSDEEVLQAPFLKKFLSGMDKIDIFLWRYLQIAAWNPGGKKCFRAIW